MNVNNEIEKVNVYHEIDETKIKLVIEKYSNSEDVSRKYLVNENGNFCGEYYSYYENEHFFIHSFYFKGIPVGQVTGYAYDGSIIRKDFFSFEKLGMEIDENEYKRQLAKIRLGIWKVPVLDLKISDYEQ